MIKNYDVFKNLLRLIKIDKYNSVEYLFILEYDYIKLDNIIKDIIMYVEYNVENYGKLL